MAKRKLGYETLSHNGALVRRLGGCLLPHLHLVVARIPVVVRVAALRHHRIDQVTPDVRPAAATAHRHVTGSMLLADGPRPVARALMIGEMRARVAIRADRAVPPSAQGHGGRPMIARAVVAPRAGTPAAIGVIREVTVT